MRTGSLETQMSMDAALERVASSEWNGQARAWFADAIHFGWEMNADSLRDWCGDPPSDNAMGALFREFEKAGKIEMVGERRSSRPQARGRWVRVWRGVQRPFSMPAPSQNITDEDVADLERDLREQR